MEMTMSMNLSLIDNVRGTATFQYYRDGNLWYTNDIGLLFPVSVAELDTATANATEKASIFMRYIRKYIESVKEAQDA
jgi:hypothetical protein